MEAFELRAYEVLGFWTVVLIRVSTDENGQITRELMYKGDHVPIDDEDTHTRAVLVLSQVVHDLEWDLSQHSETASPIAARRAH